MVRTTGTIAGIAGLRATTTYTLKPGDQFVTVETVLQNASGAAVHAWTGDAIDHDASGQRSAVSGHPPITISEDRAYPPAGRWIGMTGTDPQVFGLVYADASGPFSAYAAFNWVMSRFEVDIPAGGSYTLTRRLVVAPGSDPIAVLDAVPAP